MQILFRKNAKGIFSALIRLVSWSKYSHVTLKPNWTQGCISSNERNGGVAFEEVSGNELKWDIYEVIDPKFGTKFDDEEEAIVQHWCLSHYGAKYDWKAIWQFRPTYTGDRTGDPDAWICSEFCQTAIGQVLTVLLKHKIRNPGGLYRLMNKLGMLVKVESETK
jgi:hypothetical protein